MGRGWSVQNGINLYTTCRREDFLNSAKKQKDICFLRRNERKVSFRAPKEAQRMKINSFLCRKRILVRFLAHFFHFKEKIPVPCPAQKMRLLQVVYKKQAFWTDHEGSMRKIQKSLYRNNLPDKIDGPNSQTG